MEELAQLLQLIELERKEDLKQYQNSVIMTPLHERKKKGLTWYPIKITHTEIGAGENFQISLERKSQIDENHVFQVGGMVSLFNNAQDKSKNPSISGVIASVWKNSMRISFNLDELPDWLEYGSLGVDMLFDSLTYQEMKEALEKVSNAEEGRLVELRNIFFGKKTANFLPSVPEYFQSESLNESQNLAVQNILKAQDVAIIHGPPGTGKTTTLVEAVKFTLQNERQVLVTAPSNTAVDLLTERLAKKGVKVLRIGNPARIDEDLIQYSLETQIAQHADFRFLKKLRKQAEEFKKMAHKYKRKFGKAEKEQRRALFAEAAKMLGEATVLEKYIVDSLLNEAQVITATLVGSVNKYIRYREFSTVFIDEAAQALEPATWIPITKSQRVIFAGDHCQLPPTVKSYEAEKAGLSKTLFEKTMERQKAEVMLQTQYRMHEKIMNFSNQEFYHEDLIADETVRTHSLTDNPEDSILATSVEFVDTAGCSFQEVSSEENQSKHNPEEGNLLLTHLAQVFNQIYMVKRNLLETDFSVGIISPYKAQVNYLKESLKTHPDLEAFQEFINVNTVDGFQGQERDVIYISLVRSNEKGRIGFLSDTRRMNVALTRAKKKLVVFGDSATLSHHEFYQRFLDYIQSIEAHRTAWEWISV